MIVVVVESPAKAKSIGGYLGPGYTVLASYGHVRDLPERDGAVRPDEDFALEWVLSPRGAQKVAAVAEALRGADQLILATDPDREGEAIAWHLLAALRDMRALDRHAVSRVTFNAITKDAVTRAMAAPRDIDMSLVDAYLARRALDHLVGFTLSRVLWRRLPGARSAGRVQSVALRLVVEREMEIERFRPQAYWTLEAVLAAPGGEPVHARLVEFQGVRPDDQQLATAEQAEEALAAVRAGTFRVAAVEATPFRRTPPPPFTTSTLQQEAARKLGFSAVRTMRAAQRLYEGVDVSGETIGLITYMRTDGVTIDGEALRDLRALVAADFGEACLGAGRSGAGAPNAQGAHEPIRPTDPTRRPGGLGLSGDEALLYDLIWKRTLASQMESARLERTTVDFTEPAGRLRLRATGQVMLSAGFTQLYQEDREDPHAAQEEDSRRLPPLHPGDAMALASADASRRLTRPPGRYSEASLISALERRGIGRPSTYASTLETLRQRHYVRMEKKQFIPEPEGRLVTTFLLTFFADYVGYDFTAGLESQLDEVARGALPWKALLRGFWADFHRASDGMGDLRTGEVIDRLDEELAAHLFPAREDGSDPRACPVCASGRLSLRLGRNGPFIGCSGFPDCRHTRPLAGAAHDGGDGARPQDRDLGRDPASGEPIRLRNGRYGPYVQRGEGEGSRRIGLPKEWPPEALDCGRALELLSLPRNVGPHPDDGQMIRAGLGRHGPYLEHAGTYVSLKGMADVLGIDMAEAVARLSERSAGSADAPAGRRRRAGQGLRRTDRPRQG